MNVQYIFNPKRLCGNPVRKTRKSRGVAKRKKSSNLIGKGTPMAKRKKTRRKATKKNPKRVHYKKPGAKKTPPKRVVIPKRSEIRRVEAAARAAQAGLKRSKTQKAKLKYFKALKKAQTGIDRLKKQFGEAQKKQSELKAGGWTVYKSENIPVTRRKKGKTMPKKKRRKKATKKKARRKVSKKRKTVRKRRRTFKKKATLAVPKALKVGQGRVAGKFRRKKRSYTVRARRVSKPTYRRTKVRANPNGGKFGKYLAHSGAEALYLMAGGASFGAINSFVMRTPALANIVMKLDSLPGGALVSRVLGPSLPPLVLGVALNALVGSRFGAKVPGRPMVAKYAKGLIAAAVVGLGASIPETIAGVKAGVQGIPSMRGFPSMRGVDFTPYSGVDYTPMNGVDYTPYSGAEQQLGQADFGAAEQQLGQYIEEDPRRASNPSDFGQAADFGAAESSDMGDAVQQMG